MQSLHEAVSMNRPEEIDDLVRNGADVNKKDAIALVGVPLLICVHLLKASGILMVVSFSIDSIP